MDIEKCKSNVILSLFLLSCIFGKYPSYLVSLTDYPLETKPGYSLFLTSLFFFFFALCTLILDNDTVLHCYIVIFCVFSVDKMTQKEVN